MCQSCWCSMACCGWSSNSFIIVGVTTATLSATLPPGGTHWGCHSCSPCDPKGHLGSLPVAPASPVPLNSDQPAIMRNTAPCSRSSQERADVDMSWRWPCCRALSPSWLCQPGGPTRCLSPLQPWHGPSLPSSASFRRHEPPQPMFGNFLSCPGPPGAKQGAASASGGRAGTGGDTLRPQQPEQCGLCSFGPSGTSQLLSSGTSSVLSLSSWV